MGDWSTKYFCGKDEFTLNYVAVKKRLDELKIPQARVAQELRGFDEGSLSKNIKAIKKNTKNSPKIGDNMLNIFGPIIYDEFETFLKWVTPYPENKSRNIFQFLQVVMTEADIPYLIKESMYIAFLVYKEKKCIKDTKTELRLISAENSLEYKCFASVCKNYFNKFSFSKTHAACGVGINPENNWYEKSWDIVEKSVKGNVSQLMTDTREQYTKLLTSDILKTLTCDVISSVLENDKLEAKNLSDIIDDEIEKKLSDRYRYIVDNTSLGDYDFYFHMAPKSSSENGTNYTLPEEVKLKEIYFRCLFAKIAETLSKREINFFLSEMQNKRDFKLTKHNIEKYDLECAQYSVKNQSKFKLSDIEELASLLECSVGYLIGTSLWPHVDYVPSRGFTGIDHKISPNVFKRFDEHLVAKEYFYNENYHYIIEITECFIDLNPSEKRQLVNALKQERKYINTQREIDIEKEKNAFKKSDVSETTQKELNLLEKRVMSYIKKEIDMLKKKYPDEDLLKDLKDLEGKLVLCLQKEINEFKKDSASKITAKYLKEIEEHLTADIIREINMFGNDLSTSVEDKEKTREKRVKHLNKKYGEDNIFEKLENKKENTAE